MVFSSGTFDVVAPNEPAPTLPLRLTLLPDRARTTARLLLIVPGLCALLVPASLAVFLLAGTAPSTAVPHDAFTTAALVAQPILWLLLAAAAGWSLLPRIGRKRLVTIGTEQVSVLETGLLGLRAWRSSLSGYRGIAHHVRATAGVVMHEIILVHERADQSVLLHTAPMVAQSSIEHYSTLLRLPVITSRDVYRLRLPRWDLSGLQAVRSGLAWQRGA